MCGPARWSSRPAHTPTPARPPLASALTSRIMTPPHPSAGEPRAAGRPRSRLRTALRWTGRILGAVVVLVLVAAGAVYGLSERRLHARFTPPEHALVVKNDAATIARGQHLATTRGCADCHGANLGGTVMVADPAFGRLAAPNLTVGRRGGTLSDREWELAVRHGMRADGSALLVMPSAEFTGMSDEDLAAIVAYARSVPAADTTQPASVAGPIPRALLVAGKMALLPAEIVDHAKPHVAHMEAAPTVEYGKYVAANCTGCHGATFAGGKISGGPPGMMPAANLTPAGRLGKWSEAEFISALRTGVRPDGTKIDANQMPIAMVGKMDDVELQAVYRYLRSLPPQADGAK